MIEPPILRGRCLLLEFFSTWVDIQTHNTCHHSNCCDELCDKLQEVYGICRAWWMVWWVTVWMLKVLDRMWKFGDQEFNYPALLCVQDNPGNTSIAILLVCLALHRGSSWTAIGWSLRDQGCMCMVDLQATELHKFFWLLISQVPLLEYLVYKYIYDKPGWLSNIPKTYFWQEDIFIGHYNTLICKKKCSQKHLNCTCTMSSLSWSHIWQLNTNFKGFQKQAL